MFADSVDDLRVRIAIPTNGWRSRPTSVCDAGFTMIELMVSMVILAMVSSAFAYGLQLSLSVTRDDRAGIQAANLAARELEILRNEFGASKSAPIAIGAESKVNNPNPLKKVGGQNDTAIGQPYNLDGTKFTVVRTVQWLPSGTGTSPCDGGSAVTYPSLGANVKVSWTDSGRTREVQSNTVLTPPKGTLATVKGFIAAKVQGADGKGVASLPVDISGPGGSQAVVTAADGCAVFALSVVGNYTVTLSQPGYVSFDGQPSTSKEAAVGQGSIQVVPFSYDRAATLEIAYVVADGVAPEYKLPNPVPSIVLFNSGLPTLGKKQVAGGVSSVGGLWPFANGYSVWAGTCAVNDPAVTGGSRPVPVAANPGKSEVVEVILRPVRLTFLDDQEQPIPDAQVTAVVNNPSGCQEKTFGLGTTDVDGVVKSSLPYGQWTVTAKKGASQVGESLQANVLANGSVTYPLVIPDEVD
ncbi:MAG: prepilin-type N-terminal cleavage/methylation domain-containing protein [Candidatus Nanopelagicales bacterium]